jgi:hypothetical protein
MFIPVTKIKKILDAVITLVKDDYNAALQAGIEEESFLYRVLYGNTLGDFDFYEQGKDIFIRTDASARQIQTRMGFDLGMATLPTIYVHQPSEAMKGINTIGWGYDTNEFYNNTDGSQTDKLFRGSGSVFEYVITSPNVLETILVYEVLYAALNGAIDTLSEYFNNVSIVGKELVAKNEEMSTPLFIKTIQMDMDYVKEFPRLGTPQSFLSLVEFYPATVYDVKAIGEELI